MSPLLSSSFTGMCPANHIGGKKRRNNLFSRNASTTREANEKMVLEPLLNASDTP
jgi:hypothetical protein